MMKAVRVVRKRIAQASRAVITWATTKPPKRYYGVGDLAPESLLNRPKDSGPIGAWITVDPVTHRITAIHAP